MTACILVSSQPHEGCHELLPSLTQAAYNWAVAAYHHHGKDHPETRAAVAAIEAADPQAWVLKLLSGLTFPMLSLASRHVRGNKMEAAVSKRWHQLMGRCAECSEASTHAHVGRTHVRSMLSVSFLNSMPCCMQPPSGWPRIVYQHVSRA
jgi:hypothetical protein